MKKHLSRNGVIIFGAAATAVLVGGYFFWWQEPEHAKTARQRARELNVREFDLRDAATQSYVFGFDSHELLIRTKNGNSNLLLLRTKSGVVFEYDADTGSASQAPFEAWDAASGEIADEIQTSYCKGCSHDQDTGRLMLHGVPAGTKARNHMAVVSSRSDEKIAIVSADGRFTPGSPGMIFGGTWARASGQHYVEIIRVSDGALLGEPIAIPFSTSWRKGIDILWSADERFIVCRTGYTQYCVVPTGLNHPRGHGSQIVSPSLP